MIKRIIDKKIICEIFNVGTGKPKNVKKVIELIKKKNQERKTYFWKNSFEKRRNFQTLSKNNKSKKIIRLETKDKF